MKAREYEPLDCICGAAADKTQPIGSKDGLVVAHCLGCGIIRTPWTFKNYETFYTDGDRYHVERQGQIPYRERFEHDRNIAHLRLKKFHEVSQPRWLDVGCANGGFVMEAHDYYEAEGLELNPHMAEWAAKQTGRPIHTSWDTVEGLFDVVSLHDVLEHVPNPRTMLWDIRDRLVLNGFVIIDCPDGEHEDFVADPMASRHTKPREHLWFFREQDLRQLLADTRFAVHHIDRPIPGKVVVYGRPI